MGTEKNLPMNLDTVLVTGGGGFVGSGIVKKLLSRGISVRIVGRNPYPHLQKIGAICYTGSITDMELMQEATKGVDLVFHVAALAGIWGKWRDYYLSNVQGTKTVLAACHQNQVPSLVYTSTPSVVFNGDDLEGVGEETPYATSFLCHYAKSKVLAEKMVLASSASDFRVCALRPHLIWGPGDPHLLPRLIKSGQKKQLKMVGEGNNLVDISYIDNVVHAHLLAAHNLSTSATGSGKAFFISQGQAVNLWSWINDLFVRLDIAPVEKSVPFQLAAGIGGAMELSYKLLHLQGEPGMTRFLAEQLAKSHYFSIEAARNILDYQPVVSTDEGLNKTVQWIKANGIV